MTRDLAYKTCGTYYQERHRLAVKEAVFGKHKKMLKLYEQYCNLLQPGAPMYWGDVDEIVDPSAIAEAANVNEASCADGF